VKSNTPSSLSAAMQPANFASIRLTFSTPINESNRFVRAPSQEATLLALALYLRGRLLAYRYRQPRTGDPDKAWRRRMTSKQWRHLESLCDSHRSGPSGQPSGSLKLKLSSLLRASLARWRLSALSGTTVAPAPGTVATARKIALPAPEFAASTMQQAIAGSIGASEIGHKIVPSLAATEESKGN
jgi:hypothetical protein